MRRAVSAIAVVGALVAVLAAAPTGGAAGKGSTTIKLGDNFFSPSSKSVAAGTTVRFKWTGNNAHNVTKKRGPGGAIASTTTDDAGVNFEKKLRKAGTYRFICTNHPEQMKLKLKVG